MSYEPRVPLPDGALVDSVPDMPTVLRHYLPDTAEVRQDFNAALGTSVVDPTTCEVVRIYNASAVDCNYCKNVRYSKDGAAVIGEDLVAQVRSNDLDHLSDEHQAAVRLAHAYALDPAGLSEEDAGQVRQQFTQRQVAELGLQLLRCRAGSKTLVTLGLEPRSMDLTLI